MSFAPSPPLLRTLDRELLRVIFALPKVRALIPEGCRDGPAQIFTDLIVGVGIRPKAQRFAVIVRFGIPAGP